MICLKHGNFYENDKNKCRKLGCLTCGRSKHIGYWRSVDERMVELRLFFSQRLKEETPPSPAACVPAHGIKSVREPRLMLRWMLTSSVNLVRGGAILCTGTWYGIINLPQREFLLHIDQITKIVLNNVFKTKEIRHSFNCNTHSYFSNLQYSQFLAWYYIVSTRQRTSLGEPLVSSRQEIFHSVLWIQTSVLRSLPFYPEFAILSRRC